MIAKLPPSKKKASTTKKFVEDRPVTPMNEGLVEPIIPQQSEEDTEFPLWVILSALIFACVVIAAVIFLWNR